MTFQLIFDHDLRGAINLLRSQATAGTGPSYEHKVSDTKKRFKATKMTIEEGEVKKADADGNEDILHTIRNAMENLDAEHEGPFSPSKIPHTVLKKAVKGIKRRAAPAIDVSVPFSFCHLLLLWPCLLGCVLGHHFLILLLF